MTPTIKVVLTFSGEKITLSKPMDDSRKDFSTCIAANIENELSIIPLFRDGKDLTKALEDKIFPVLKIFDPTNSAASATYRI